MFYYPKQQFRYLIERKNSLISDGFLQGILVLKKGGGIIKVKILNLKIKNGKYYLKENFMIWMDPFCWPKQIPTNAYFKRDRRKNRNKIKYLQL